MIEKFIVGSAALADALAITTAASVEYAGPWAIVYSGEDALQLPAAAPVEVTMRQARLALHAAGKLTAVHAAINALPDPPKTAALIEWEYSSTVRRDSQFVALLGPALGLDAAGLDALFVAASQLKS